MNDFLSWVVGTSKPCDWSPSTPVKRTIFSLGLMGNINLQERKASRLHVSLVIFFFLKENIEKYSKQSKTKRLTITSISLVPAYLGFPDSSVGKESPCKAGDLGSIPGWEDPLEKGKATHSSILSWRIPWTI